MKPETTRRLVEMLLADPTPKGISAVIESNPALLTPAVDEPLAYLLDAARRDGDDHRRLDLEWCAGLLRDARAFGPRAVVAALSGDEFAGDELVDPGMEHWEQYRGTGDPAMLDAAIERWEADLAEVSPSSTDYPGRLTSVASGLMARFQRLGDPSDLARALETAEAAVRATPPRAPQRATRISTWAGALLVRYASSRRVEDLDRALESLREAVHAAPPRSPERALCLHNLSGGAYFRYLRLRRRDDLEATIAASQEAVDLTPPGSTDYAERQIGLAVALERNHLDYDDEASLDGALSAWREAIYEGSPGAAVDVEVLLGYGRALSRRQALHQTPADRAAAVEILTLAYMYGCDDAKPLLPELFAAAAVVEQRRELANFLERLRAELAKFNETGNLVALDAARRGWPLSLSHPALAEEHAAARASALSEAGLAFWARFHARGDMVDLDGAVEVFEEAVALTTAGSPGRSVHRNNLGLALSERYGHTRRSADIVRARELLEAALEDDPPAEDRPGIRGNLARVLALGAYGGSDVRPLLRALELLAAALEEIPEDSPELMGLSLSRAGMRLELYDRTGFAADLDLAQTELETLVRRAGSNVDRQRGLCLLANALEKRYDLSKDPEPLKRAVTLSEQAVDIDRETPQGLVMLGQLGMLRYRLAEELGRVSEADRAVDALAAALEGTAADAPERPNRLAMLAAAKLGRDERRNDAGERTEVLDLLHTAHAQMSGSWEGLALAPWLAISVYEHVRDTGDPKVLDDAIAAVSEAAPEMPSLHLPLGALLSERYLRDGRREDLDAAIGELDGSDSGPLAVALVWRHRLAGDPTDRARAVEVLRRRSEDVSPRMALSAARVWAHLEVEAGAWWAAAEGYRLGLDALRAHPDRAWPA